ncbi:MAG TPA: glycosyltransferase 87 family protein [Solirubrobacteraceae bacterium]|nr:glycosyltransferase 87 family protein [Solirubrobacteraceae bacterium]
MSVHGPLSVSGGGALEFGGRPPRSVSTAASTRLGLLALGGVLLAGSLLAVSAAGTDTLLPQSVRPIPGWLAGPFGSTGIDIGSGGAIAVLVLMFAGYAAAVSLSDRLSPRAVLATIAALNALVLLAPPLLSTDIFSYQAYARMWVSYGANPYLHGPSVIALDPLYSYVGARWVTTPSAYGPLFTLISAAVAQASIVTSAFAFKLAAAAASVGTVALLWHAARLRGLNPVRTAVLFGLNPLVVVYGVGGGHNDMLMLLALAAALWAALARRTRTGGAFLAVSVGLKLTAGLMLPFVVASERARGRRRELLLGFVVAGAAIAVATAVAFGTGPLALPGTLAKIQQSGDWHSIPGFITTRLGLHTIGRVTGYVLGAAFLSATAWLLRRVWRGQLDWIDGAAWATLAMLLTAGSLLPWYGSWLLPLVGLSGDRRLWRAALLFTGVAQLIQLFDYIPHGSMLAGL